jgi:hypothetical protein
MRLHYELPERQGPDHLCNPYMHPERNVRSASLPSFSIVPVIPLPISAALLANSDRAPFLGPLTSPFGDPFAALLCDSVSRDCLCWPIFADDCRFCACARTALNSAVRSCMDVVVISTGHGDLASMPIATLRTCFQMSCNAPGRRPQAFWWVAGGKIGDGAGYFLSLGKGGNSVLHVEDG